MEIGICTDYISGIKTPELYLKLAAEAGFTHIHWCHQWNTDYLYSRHEVRFYREKFKEYGLTLQDIHGSTGQEKLWYSLEEHRRKAGVELVRNRIEMFADLEGTGGIAMHIPCYRLGCGFYQHELDKIPRYLEALRRTLDELMPDLEKYNARIAVENMPNEAFEVATALTNSYPAEHLGITYDSGHGNYGYCQGLDYIENLKDRIAVLHLHDNDGGSDQHQPPFYGTVDWERVAKVVAASAYTGPLNFELVMKNTPFFNPELKEQPEDKVKKFLADAYERCSRVVRMYEAARKG